MDVNLKQMYIKEEFEPEIGSTELVFETVNVPCTTSNHTKSIAIWSSEETKKLIELYKKFMADVGPYNRFKRKKDMWIEISSRIPNMSAKQCEERLKTILRRKRKGIIEEVRLTNRKKKLLDLQDEENELNIGRKPEINLAVDESITPNKSIQVWSACETKLLVGLYKTFINEVGPHKKFVHKKDMWAQIALNLDNKDPRQCEQRFNTLFKRKKKCATKAYVTKVRRKSIDFRLTRHLKNNEIDEVEEEVVDDIINEDILQPQEKEESVEQTNSTCDKTTGNIEIVSMGETFKEIAAQKEAGKERRHRERMQAMTNFQNILLQMLKARKTNSTINI